MDFSNKIVLVTGASRGIGRTVAQSFAERGARVAVHYNSNAAAAQKTVQSLPGGPHMIVQADIKNAAAVREMVAKTVQEMGRLDILINNAGIYQDHPLADVSYENWQKSWQL
ncbi:MAG: SDR family NAD(P)-dependent oxidoreductase, partial [Thermoanaerobaculia bacterium]